MNPRKTFVVLSLLAALLFLGFAFIAWTTGSFVAVLYGIPFLVGAVVLFVLGRNRPAARN